MGKVNYSTLPDPDKVEGKLHVFHPEKMFFRLVVDKEHTFKPFKRRPVGEALAFFFGGAGDFDFKLALADFKQVFWRRALGAKKKVPAPECGGQSTKKKNEPEEKVTFLFHWSGVADSNR